MAGTIIIGRNVTNQTTESEGMQSTPMPTNFTFVGEGDQAGLELSEVVTAIIISVLLILVVVGLLCSRRMLRARFRNVSEVL